MTDDEKALLLRKIEGLEESLEEARLDLASCESELNEERREAEEAQDKFDNALFEAKDQMRVIRDDLTYLFGALREGRWDDALAVASEMAMVDDSSGPVITAWLTAGRARAA